MVFQNYALFPHMTVAENVAFPLKVRKVDAATARQRALQALDWCTWAGGAAQAEAAVGRPAAARGAGALRWCSSRAWC
jgi:ABC-type Fe3+/spermidine/putrescine transport system ATPase subunit